MNIKTMFIKFLRSQRLKTIRENMHKTIIIIIIINRIMVITLLNR